MRCRLPMLDVPLPTGFDVRPFAAADEGGLGQLMADAYRGGVEDHGETLGEHQQEARKTVDGGWGAVLWHASWWATRDGIPVGTTIVTDWDERNDTGLSFALVHPDARGHGLGGALIAKSGHALATTGYRDWVLAVVPENPAIRLYKRLGFRPFDPPAAS